VASEGKTLTALNLALTLSASYQRRVLLIDCDLRRPSVHDVLQVPPQPGLSDIAARTPAVPRAVSERLFIVTAGRSTDDPVSTLTSPAIAALVEQGRRDYDWVLLDTPPAAVLPDASLLSDQADGAVLVVAAGRTEYDMVTRAVASLGRDRILGVVLNGIDTRDLSVGKYQNYYYAQR
jgi:capsular exopolysaccharide synthesis family protein